MKGRHFSARLVKITSLQFGNQKKFNFKQFRKEHAGDALSVVLSMVS